MPDVNELTSLIERCRWGDDLAWESLIRQFQGAVYGLAIGYVRHPDDARDIAQEAFVRVYRGLERFDSGTPFRAWLLTVTRNLCIDHLRRRKARPPTSDVAVDHGTDLASPAADPESRVDSSGRKALLYRAIDRLSPINREIVLLKEIQGLSLAEVASMLEIPVGTVKSRSNRARVELARHVLALDPGYGRAVP